MRGFSLIELIIVLTIIAIISTIGIASFVNYSRSQTVKNVALDLVTILNTAKSKALSQVKPPSTILECNGKSLDGYEVSICQQANCISSANNYNYELHVVCEGNKGLIDGRINPSGISISPDGENFFFPVLKGGISLSNSVSITVSGFNTTKIITVYPDGRITY